MGMRTGDRPTEWEAFARAFAIENDPVAAYLRVHPRATCACAAIEGPRLLNRQEVRTLLLLLEASPGVPSELLALRTAYLACRHCHGVGHRHQRTDEEMALARHEHKQQSKKRRETLRQAGRAYTPFSFDPQGGGGFDPGRAPHAECPQCHGRGVARLAAVDLSTGRAVLVAPAQIRLRSFKGGRR